MQLGASRRQLADGASRTERSGFTDRPCEPDGSAPSREDSLEGVDDIVSLVSQVTAAIEVAGRHGVGLVPGLRPRIGRWARRPPGPTRPVSLAELERRLADLGALRGRDLLVHSSWDGLRQVQGNPSEILDLLRALAGPGATLIMPSHPIDE